MNLSREWNVVARKIGLNSPGHSDQLSCKCIQSWSRVKYSMPRYVFLSSVLAWTQPALLKHSKIKIYFPSDKLVFVSSSALALKYRVLAYVSRLHRKNKPLQAPFHLPVKEETEKKSQRSVLTQSPKVQMERMSQKSPVAISEFLTVRMSHCTPA